MDMMESRESEERERDPPIEPRANLSQIIETFRNELNSCLMRSDYEMASQFQNCIMMILDAMDGPIPMPHARRVELFTTLLGIYGGSSPYTQYPVMADRYNSYGGPLREMAHVD